MCVAAYSSSMFLSSQHLAHYHVWHKPANVTSNQHHALTYQSLKQGAAHNLVYVCF